MHPIDSTPEPGSRIRAALAAEGRPSGLPRELGGMLRVLAASKTAGHILCFGDDAGEAGAWVLDGMDIMSGLVVLVQRPEDLELLQPEFDRDVRASVHRQAVEPFLKDVNKHRFNLIVDCMPGEHPETLRLALGMLRVGGLCVVADAGKNVEQALAECGSDALDGARAGLPGPVLRAREFSVASVGAGDARLIVRRAAEPQRKRRRR